MLYKIIFLTNCVYTYIYYYTIKIIRTFFLNLMDKYNLLLQQRLLHDQLYLYIFCLTI